MPEMDIQKTIQTLEREFRSDLDALSDSRTLDAVRVKYLGRKGKISGLFKAMGELSPDNKRLAGQYLNALKEQIQSALDEKTAVKGSAAAEVDTLDITLPGNRPALGHYHPLSVVLRQITDCFKGMGFAIAQGPDVEREYYNFEALNIPKGHPARDMQDTYFVSGDIVLRTHTSPVQIHVMEKQKPPVRIIAPGRCYRRDTPDSTHSPVFHQVEGLCVDEGISFADLKGVIQTFAKRMLGSDMKIRFRPSFFPFTEPSAEYDFSCVMCRGKGCRICKGTGWVEISGAGMVNPSVFQFVDYDSEKYTGFAFGMGVERIAMLLYEVHDIRLFYENDIRFLRQF